MPTGIYVRKKTGKTINCGVCKLDFYVIPYRLKMGFGKFCSTMCFTKSEIYNNQRRINLSIAKTGKKLSEQHKINIGISGRGKKRTLLTRKRISEAHRAEKSYLWKGGITKEYYRIRHSIEFKFWRESVFKRDNWTCQDCGKRGCILHPHHIKRFAYYPELRFELSNGKTLCKECHLKIHFKTWKLKT